jgi:hypothetical protein
MQARLISTLTIGALLIGCAVSGRSDDIEIGQFPLEMKQVCQQNVADFGGEGRAATSISWESYASNQEPKSAIQFYQKKFKSSPVADGFGGQKWTTAEGVDYIVYSLEKGSRWMNCSTPAAGVKSVLLILKIRSVNAH